MRTSRDRGLGRQGGTLATCKPGTVRDDGTRRATRAKGQRRRISPVDGASHQQVACDARDESARTRHWAIKTPHHRRRSGEFADLLSQARGVSDAPLHFVLDDGYATNPLRWVNDTAITSPSRASAPTATNKGRARTHDRDRAVYRRTNIRRMADVAALGHQTSEVATVLGYNPYATPLDLWLVQDRADRTVHRQLRHRRGQQF